MILRSNNSLIDVGIEIVEIKIDIDHALPSIPHVSRSLNHPSRPTSSLPESDPESSSSSSGADFRLALALLAGTASNWGP